MRKIINFLNKIICGFFIFLIKIYQVCISPFFPKRCNFIPTCSQYMIEAIKIHGIFYGIYLGIKRILRCHPCSKGDIYDPVPEKRN